MTPGERILLGDLGELCIQLGRLRVVLLERQAAMSPKTVLIQRVDLGW